MESARERRDSRRAWIAVKGATAVGHMLDECIGVLPLEARDRVRGALVHWLQAAFDEGQAMGADLAVAVDALKAQLEMQKKITREVLRQNSDSRKEEP